MFIVCGSEVTGILDLDQLIIKTTTPKEKTTKKMSNKKMKEM